MEPRKLEPMLAEVRDAVEKLGEPTLLEIAEALPALGFYAVKHRIEVLVRRGLVVKGPVRDVYKHGPKPVTYLVVSRSSAQPAGVAR